MYPQNHVLGSQRNGLNHVSMNLGHFDRSIGPIEGTQYPLYTDGLLDWYNAKDIKSVRLMFTWEAVQRLLGGPITSDAVGGPDPINYVVYWRNLKHMLWRLLVRDIYVILCPWQYNEHSMDTDIVYDSSPFSSLHFADFWAKFATSINHATGHDQRVAFDLINEPHTHAQSGEKAGDIGITLTNWFLCAQAAVDRIRATGATNTILVPGMEYAAASSFTSNGSSEEWINLNDPSKNLAVTAHCYAGIGSSSPTVLGDACSSLVTWARSNGLKLHIGEIALDAGGNAGSLLMAETQWRNWAQFCQHNADVLVGWNWWANSAAGWWDQGDSQAGFHWGLTLDDGATQTAYMDLIEKEL